MRRALVYPIGRDVEEFMFTDVAITVYAVSFVLPDGEECSFTLAGIWKIRTFPVIEELV